MKGLDTGEARLVTTHAIAFGVGTVSLLIGVFSDDAHWFLVAGPCLTLSGLLIAVGSRITFSGPTGALLRAVLGPARVRVINIRAVVWILAGLSICLWGVERLEQQRDDERPLQEPLAGLPPPQRSHVRGRVLL